nr:hypothetical protein [Tanacetum cinerariifolium]
PTTSSIPLPSLPTAPIPPVTQTVTTPIGQYSRRARIAQSSILVTVADEPVSPVRDVSEREACPTESGFLADQDRATIDKLKDRVQVLEDRESVATKQSRDDAPIKGSGSIPTAGPPATDISTGSEVAPTASPIVTSYSRRKGKEVMVESTTLKKQRLQEQIDTQVARELEEQQEKEDMRMNEQIARDAEEELQGMIDSFDRSNETIAKYLQEYQDFASELPLEKRIELIYDLVKYQENYSKVELKRLYEPDLEDQLWAQTQNYMHASTEWKLYDLSEVHHVTANEKEIFMLVEKDYPLRKGLALVMISYKLQVENYSQMAEELIRKIYNIANTPRQ